MKSSEILHSSESVFTDLVDFEPRALATVGFASFDFDDQLVEKRERRESLSPRAYDHVV